MNKMLSSLALLILASSYSTNDQQLALSAVQAQQMDTISAADISDLVIHDELRRLKSDGEDGADGEDGSVDINASTSNTAPPADGAPA